MRFYRNELPSVDDITMCYIDSIDDKCVIVTLIEYGGIEGMVKLADVSSRKKRKTKIWVKEGRVYPLIVISVDEDRRYINLSNKYLSEEDKDNYKKKFDNYQVAIKLINNFLVDKYEEFDEEIEEQYMGKTLWNVEDPYNCLKYITDYYASDGNIDDFNLDESEITIFDNVLFEFFGSFKVISTLNFLVNNPNYSGTSKLKEIFDIIKAKYGIEVMINTSPTYYVVAENDSLNENMCLLDDINDEMEEMLRDNNCNYIKKEINTVNSLER